MPVIVDCVAITRCL